MEANHNVRDLEKAVEDLSELLEQPIDAETIGALRQKVTDKTVSVCSQLARARSDTDASAICQVYVQKRNEIVLDDSAKGYHEGRWSWNATVEGFD
jgi:ariadne-1